MSRSAKQSTLRRQTQSSQLKFPPNKHMLALCVLSLALYLWPEQLHARRVSYDQTSPSRLGLADAGQFTDQVGLTGPESKSQTLSESTSRSPKEDQELAGKSVNGATSATQAGWPNCMLGNDSFQIGDKWNPNLPPFGVQVCVLCECVFRQHKACYELKVTCRRLHNDCPGLPDLCPDGTKPVSKAGRCCKFCPNRSNQAGTNSSSEPAALADLAAGSSLASLGSVQSNSSYEGASGETSPSSSTATRAGLRVQRSALKSDKMKEYKSIVKVLPACNRREGTSERLIHSSSSTSTSSSSTLRNRIAKFSIVAGNASATNNLTSNSKSLSPKLATSTPNSSSSPEALASLREYNRQQSKNLHLVGADTSSSVPTDTSKETKSAADSPNPPACNNDNQQQSQPVFGQLFNYLINLMTRRGLTNHLDSSCPSCKH